MNLLPTIVAKSDQLNADDLVGGPRTITVTAVKGSDSPEQPVWIHFEGDDGKPFKPCKTCRRLLVHCWGPEAADFIGRRMTLYTDPNVMFGGVKTGGIRISHVSHIEREMQVALMVTRGKRAHYTVRPLKAEVVQRRQPPADDFPGDRETERNFSSGAADGGEPATWADRLEADLRSDAYPTVAALNAFTDNPDNVDEFLALQEADPARARRIEAAINGRRKALADRERGA